jgi:hypothetical protein
LIEGRLFDQAGGSDNGLNMSPPRLRIVEVGEGNGSFRIDFTGEPKVKYSGESHYELELTLPSGRNHDLPLGRRLDRIARRLLG